MQGLDSSKASSGNIPTANIRDAKEVICPNLSSCLSVVINNCHFPDKLKEDDSTAIHRMVINGKRKSTGLSLSH